MNARLGAGGVALVGLLGLVGCSGAGTPLATWEGWWDPDGLYVSTGQRGTLVLEGDCVYFRIAGGALVIPAFPSEVEWDGSEQVITLADQAARIGDRVDLPGVSIEIAEVDHIPDGCDTDVGFRSALRIGVLDG